MHCEHLTAYYILGFSLDTPVHLVHYDGSVQDIQGMLQVSGQISSHSHGLVKNE
jgi:hypothetical protein